MSVSRPSSTQFPDIVDVYERFAALTADSPELGGSLLAYAGLDWRGIALAFAANVAGAASLGLESDIVRAKAAIRSGACDFLVNTLDEALRILKNEIRKKNPVAVALVGDPRGAVAEMQERGVQPEIVWGDVPGPRWRGGSMETFVERGARRLDWGAASGDWVSWRVEREPMRWLPVLDRLAAEALDPGDKTTLARRRWLEAAPRYLGRALASERYLRMSKAEFDAFAKARLTGGVDVFVHLSRTGWRTRGL